MDVNENNDWILKPPGGSSEVFAVGTGGHVSATSFSATSDQKYKEHIRALPSTSALIDRLRPVSFKWKGSGVPAWGFVAQEVQRVAPQLVEAGHADHLQLRVLEFLPVLVRELQDLRRRCAALETKLL